MVFFPSPSTRQRATLQRVLNLYQKCWKPTMLPGMSSPASARNPPDLRKIVQTALDRNRKKLSLQQKQMKDTEKKDKYKIYGELINTYGYGLEEGCKSFKALNYYNGEEITIPLDPTLTPQEELKKYFDRYGKLKRTQEALEIQIADRLPAKSSIWSLFPMLLTLPQRKVTFPRLRKS